MWLLLAAVLLLMAGAVCAAHIPGVRTLTGAAPLEPDERPGGTLRAALDELSISHDHHGGAT
jgi:hypothetical protein